jgi:putative ABC transport system substrate-binding protein
MNNRRKLLVALGASALTTPLRSFAQQQGKVWRIGYLSQTVRPASSDSGTFGVFWRGMRDLGYVEGKNLVIESRFADGRVERIPGLAAELVQLKVDLILAGDGTPATSAAQKATATIPIVMSTGDPVGSGFIKSLAHPGGNITGVSNLSGDMGPKHLEMLASMVPKLSRVAVILDPSNSSHPPLIKSIVAAAQKVGVKILPVEARSAKEIENAFSIMVKERAGAIIVLPTSIFALQRNQIAELAAKTRLPSIAATRNYADVGVLMSYGPNQEDIYRRLATYVDKILKGAKPADIPVEQPMIFELFINGKTAKALGLKIPPSLLILTDKVIE